MHGINNSVSIFQDILQQFQEQLKKALVMCNIIWNWSFYMTISVALWKLTISLYECRQHLQTYPTCIYMEFCVWYCVIRTNTKIYG